MLTRTVKTEPEFGATPPTVINCPLLTDVVKSDNCVVGFNHIGTEP